MQKKIFIAIRDFALPVPRVGSIEMHSGYGRAAADGQEIHLRVQEKRAKAHADYRSEVKITHEFERGRYKFIVVGLVDGLFASDPPCIEEIKSSFNLFEITKKINQGSFTHPYCLQLKTYGYFYWLQNRVMPKLRFHLVSSRTFLGENLEISLDINEYESWLEKRLDQLVDEAKQSEKRLKRRKRTAKNFVFPFENPRPGQVELIETIEQGMRDEKRMLVQAPTGLGKTVGVLYPALKQALARGQKVVYVTPKNSQHSVAEDAVARFQDKGAELKSLTLTAKSKICFKNEPLCNPEYCEYAKDHYTKVDQNELPRLLEEQGSLSADVFREIGEKYEVCPFELQLEAAHQVEVVICDYNYVFAPRTAFGRLNASALGQEGNPNLVIDEAHNLLSRAMDYYSPALSTFALEKMRAPLQELPYKFRADAVQLLEDCIQSVEACRPRGNEKSMKIDPPAEVFLEQEGRLRAFLSRYLDSDVEILPKDPVLRMCFYWSEFTAALDFVADPDRAEFFTTFQSHPSGKGTVKITCCDASRMLETCYDEYEQVVGFSATLKPFDYYAKLSGLELEKLKTAEFQSPFPRAHRKLLIIPQISTKYSDRERSYPRVAEVIEKIASVKPGNYFAFFPSFEFMERVLQIFITPKGFKILKQEREMKAADLQLILSQIYAQTQPTLVFAVQGGVFSEGVDYPGESIIGAFVVGPPLPSFDLEREEMREYYQRHYAAGFDYAYTFPAMAKAVQAAGRVIRSETDRGLIVMIDNRFIQPSYSQSMPTDWFSESPRELVSRGILKEVADFWSGIADNT